MKPAISGWSFPGGLEGHQDYGPVARQARQAGFEGLEVALSPQGCLTPQTSDAEISRIAASIRSEGVEITSLASVLFWDYPPSSPDASIRRKAGDLLKRMIAVAAQLKVDAILVIPGSVDVFFNPSIPVVDYRDAWSRAQEALAAVLPDAEKAGVSLAIENVWNRFLLSPMEMVRFIDQFDSKYVGSYFDVGNVMLFGYPDQWIRALGPRIRRVHVKDFRRDVGTAHGFVDLLSGDVDWPAVVAALREVGYDGFCTAEMIPGYKHHPAVLIENTGRALRAILGS